MERTKDKKIKALALLSGGLDSILAAKLLLEQGIGVEGICFYSNFFDCELARKAAEQLEISLREIDIREEFLQFLKEKPKHGYGVGLNPCIDCHALMFRKAGEIMKIDKFDFVATGEVLNERPMSQHKQALGIVEREAGLEGYLLRPLSARLLEPTQPEIDGLVDRSKLMDISGRGRQKQMDLAEKFGIADYPSPAGGCALTQSGFVLRLQELIANKPDFNAEDVELVKIGRHFWIDGVQVVLGRKKEENKVLLKFKKEKDIIIEPENFAGPSALIRENCDEKIIDEAKKLIIKYSPKEKGKNFQFTMINFH
jgi:tRNA U34 2-thiouridine synthase MnmA/TrmU